MTLEQLETIQDLHDAYNNADDVVIMLSGVVSNGGGFLKADKVPSMDSSTSAPAQCDKELATRLYKVAKEYSDELHSKFDAIKVEGIDED